jgi:homoserine dehydrogenase
VRTYNRNVGPDRTRPPLRVALLGLGTVGRAVAERLVDVEWRTAAERRGNAVPDLVAIGVREPERHRGITLPSFVRLTDDIAGLARDQAIDVIVELVGGTEDARNAVETAVDAGKLVVTANKALLASNGAELEAKARATGATLRFEAAVCAGVPVLGPIVGDLSANGIERVRGVVNGTTNHILTAMARDARTYEDVLGEAQARGYAEADPDADVCGHDTADKLAILVRLCFGSWPDRAPIPRATPTLRHEPNVGITGVTSRELRDARALGLSLRLVTRAERRDDGSLTGGATMAAVPADSPLGAVSGITNVVEIQASPIGTVSFRGPGAGGAATSSAVLADLLALSRGEGSTWGTLPPASTGELVSDLERPRAWFLAAPELAIGTFASEVTSFAVVSTEEALVTRPMDAEEVRARVANAGIESATLYPVLEVGE